jgi:transcriptional regulator with XRE-family HTH domain
VPRRRLSSPTTSRLCTAIFAAYKASGLSQKALAAEVSRRLGAKYAQSQLQRTLHGLGWIQIPVLEALCGALGLSFPELVTNSSGTVVHHLTPEEAAAVRAMRRRGPATFVSVLELLPPTEPRRRRALPVTRR